MKYYFLRGFISLIVMFLGYEEVLLTLYDQIARTILPIANSKNFHILRGLNMCLIFIGKYAKTHAIICSIYTFFLLQT